MGQGPQAMGQAPDWHSNIIGDFPKGNKRGMNLIALQSMGSILILLKHVKAIEENSAA